MRNMYSNLRIIMLAVGSILFGCVKDDDDKSVILCDLPEVAANVQLTNEGYLVSWQKPGHAYDELAIFIRNIHEPVAAISFSGLLIEDLTKTSAIIPGTAYYPDATYVGYVHVGRSGERNCEAETFTFTTPCAPFTTFRVEPLQSSSWVILNWHVGGTGATNNFSRFNLFTVNLRKKGTASVEFYSTDQHHIEITDLDPKTDYEAQLVYLCTDGETYLTPWIEFSTT